MTHQEFQSCIQACIECAQACEHCATACLSERDVAKMAPCIRLDRDCAGMCWQAAAFMSRDSQFAQELCRVCADVCEACGAECRKHKMDHCQRCADACERCAEECRRMSHATA
ncbi:MAG: four-helix bundle copper-binding protein [Aureliella sp.]